MNASLYHPTDGPWADVSARFVDATEGEIRTLTGGAVPDRVFGQTEIPHAINNEKITFIDGIPREDLKSRGAADAFKAISLQSDIYAAELKFAVDSDGKLIKAPTYGADGAKLGDLPRLDSSDFFAATGIPSKDPPIVFEHYRNGANFPPQLSHNQLEFHREGAEIIHEIKTHYIEQSRLTGIDHAALRAAAVRVLDKLGWAGDLVALGLVAGEANAAIEQGDHERAATLLGRWMAEFGGGLAGGLAAAQLVGSALAPLYLMGPAGAIAAGSLTLLAGLAGGLLGEAAAGAAFDAVKAEMQKLFGQATASTDPLVLDLDGDGVTTLALSESTVYFDLDNNGFAERTGWVSPKDGLLVLDRNGNGKIDSGAELFGNHTSLANGRKAADGLQALAAFDLNGDRVINASDQVFHQLRIWKDINSNGMTDEGELLSLNDANVASLDLSASSHRYIDSAGNDHRLMSQFETTDGRWLAMDDVWLNTAPQDSRALQQYATTAAIDRLPDLPSMGNTLSLHQAMAADTTGLLQSLVERWIAVPADRQQLIHEIVQTWVGVSGVDPHSRGPFIDGRQLATVEVLMGQGFILAGWDVPDPTFLPSRLLMKAYDAFVDYVQSQFSLQTEFPALLQKVGVKVDHDLSVQLDVSALKAQWWEEWQADLSFDHSVARDLLTTRLRTMTQAGEAGQMLLQALALSPGVSGQSEEFADALHYQWREVIRGTDGNDMLDSRPRDHAVIVEGGAGHDAIWGSGYDDRLLGGDGDDAIYGSGGNDVFVGGKGNDWLISEGVNDTFLIQEGDGNDTICMFGPKPEEGVNVLRFGSGINPDDLVVRRDYHSLVLSWGKEDSVRLFDMWNRPDVVTKVKFASGEVVTAEELFERAEAHGSQWADFIDGADNRVNRMWGHGGDDRLSGGSLNDSFTGGIGNDWLLGGEGSDVYHFGRGDGWDWLSEWDESSDDVDVLMLGEGILATDLRFEREGRHLHIHFAGGEEQVTVGNWFDTFIKGSRLEEIRFSEGDIQVLRDEDIEAMLEGKSLPLPQSPSSEASTLKSLVLSAALVNVATPLTPLDASILGV